MYLPYYQNYKEMCMNEHLKEKMNFQSSVDNVP